ncbi:hypothetical protein D3C84_725850 [compost metagenome]
MSISNISRDLCAFRYAVDPAIMTGSRKSHIFYEEISIPHFHFTNMETSAIFHFESSDPLLGYFCKHGEFYRVTKSPFPFISKLFVFFSPEIEQRSKPYRITTFTNIEFRRTKFCTVWSREAYQFHR